MKASISPANGLPYQDVLFYSLQSYPTAVEPYGLVIDWTGSYIQNISAGYRMISFLQRQTYGLNINETNSQWIELVGAVK